MMGSRCREHIKRRGERGVPVPDQERNAIGGAAGFIIRLRACWVTLPVG